MCAKKISILNCNWRFVERLKATLYSQLHVIGIYLASIQFFIQTNTKNYLIIRMLSFIFIEQYFQYALKYSESLMIWFLAALGTVPLYFWISPHWWHLIAFMHQSIESPGGGGGGRDMRGYCSGKKINK